MHWKKTRVTCLRCDAASPPARRCRPRSFIAGSSSPACPSLTASARPKCWHIFISNRVDDIRPGTSGKPVVGYEVKIVDEKGAAVPKGEIGTLWVKGELNARCYWNNPEKTRNTMDGAWLNTGDMYYVDADGYYVNAGRGDDMLKVGGMWCSPIEIEVKLLAHPKVREAAVVGRTDENDLVRPAAYLVLANPADETMAPRASYKHFAGESRRPQMPALVSFCARNPKDGDGKIQRFKLRQSSPELSEQLAETSANPLNQHHERS